MNKGNSGDRDKIIDYSHLVKKEALLEINIHKIFASYMKTIQHFVCYTIVTSYYLIPLH